MNALVVLVFLLIIILYLIYTLAKRKFDYWQKRNVPYLKPLPILGNYAGYILLQEFPGHLVQRLCQNFPNAPYFGAFFGTEPVLIIQSPELLKHVLTKDFHYFNGREISKYTSQEMVTQNLFFAGGDSWKVMRTNLTPLFSTSKMKNMFYLTEKCCHMFEDALDRETSISDVIEARDMCTRYTMDNFVSCAFGVEANVLSKPNNNPFIFMGDEIFKPTNYRGFKIILRAVWPAIFYGLGFKCFPNSLDSFFLKMLKDVFQSRNYKPSARNDFVDQVLTWNRGDFITSDSIKSVKTGLEEKVKLKVDDELLVSLCVNFFAAGFETSSTTLSFALFELAKNQEVQKRAAEEVDMFLRRHNNKINYECVNELPFVEACMYETIRMYPVIGNLTREVMENCTLPDGLRLDKGVRIHVPAYHLHFNPDYFPEPEEYRPERFLPENKKDIKQYTFLPFGEGPRICIGKRFAIMQVLAGLVSFLKTYRVELAEGMGKTVPLEGRSFLIQPRETPIMLKMYKREGWEQRRFLRTYSYSYVLEQKIRTNCFLSQPSQIGR